MSNNGPRYQARIGSPLGHSCCMVAAVIDTLLPPHGAEVLCECTNLEVAKDIARALNRNAMS